MNPHQLEDGSARRLWIGWQPASEFAVPIGGAPPTLLPDATSPNPIHLTRRQWQVMNGRRRGMAVKQIAAEPGLSISTIKTHLRRVLLKASAEAVFRLTPAACQRCPTLGQPSSQPWAGHKESLSPANQQGSSAVALRVYERPNGKT